MMGRKSNKGKEKKLKHKEEQKKRAEGQALVDAANEKVDHLSSLATLFRRFEKNELQINFDCLKATKMTDNDMAEAFSLTKQNMKELYERSSWGWKEKEKFEEMTSDEAWYLLGRDEGNKIVAISHFRFDMDNDEEVLYCYEIQLAENVRGKGLGKFMLQILELVGFRAKMKKLMVTVFKENESAVKFFNKLKYIVDETSPRYYDAMHPEDYDYEILSKMLLKKI